MGLIRGLLLTILGLGAAILVPVIARLITDDVKEWLPWIKVRLIERAVRKLPEDQRGRYTEEWSAFINETPGDLSKIIRAFGLGFAADSIAGLAYAGALTLVVERTQGAARRAINVTVGLTMIVWCTPLLLFTALAVKLDSPGPVIYRQRRIGSNGKTVDLLTFRTIHADWSMELANGLDDSEEIRNLRPRVTRIGTVLRRLGLDQMPLLINVVRGDLPIISFLRSFIPFKQ